MHLRQHWFTRIEFSAAALEAAAAADGESEAEAEGGVEGRFWMRDRGLQVVGAAAVLLLVVVPVAGGGLGNGFAAAHWDEDLPVAEEERVT